MQVVARHHSAWDSSPQVFVIGGNTADQEALTSQFKQLQYDVECVEPEQVVDKAQSGLPAGLVFLEEPATSGISDRLPPSCKQIPQIFVGTTFDSPDIYDAGVTEVIPFSIQTHADRITDQIERIIDRAHDR